MSTRFVLRLQQANFELKPGRWLVGRSDDCQLVLNDTLVSRHHATFVSDEHGVSVEDLGSRNGVLVNGLRIRLRQRLRHRDVVAIGATEMQFVVSDGNETPSPEKQTAPVMAGSDEMAISGAGVVLQLVEQSLTLGRPQVAVSILRNVCAEIDKEQSQTGLAHRLLTPTSRLALHLTSLIGGHDLVDWIFRSHRGVKVPLRPVVVDAMSDAVLRAERGREAFTTYLKWVEEAYPEMAEAHRDDHQALVARLDGLAD